MCICQYLLIIIFLISTEEKDEYDATGQRNYISPFPMLPVLPYLFLFNRASECPVAGLLIPQCFLMMRGSRDIVKVINNLYLIVSQCLVLLSQ